MTFDPSQHPRATDGTFSEKTGSTPEVGLTSPALSGGKNGIYWRKSVDPSEYDDIAVRASEFIGEHPDLLTTSKSRVIPSAKLPFEHYAHDPDNPDNEYPLVKFLLRYEDETGEERKLAVDYYDMYDSIKNEGAVSVNDALYEAIYEARESGDHPEDGFFDTDSGVYARFGSVSRASAYYDSARKMKASAEAFFGEEKLEELMNGE